MDAQCARPRKRASGRRARGGHRQVSEARSPHRRASSARAPGSLARPLCPSPWASRASFGTASGSWERSEPQLRRKRPPGAPAATNRLRPTNAAGDHFFLWRAAGPDITRDSDITYVTSGCTLNAGSQRMRVALRSRAMARRRESERLASSKTPRGSAPPTFCGCVAWTEERVH